MGSADDRTYYFNPVQTRNAPLAEAAFLNRASAQSTRASSALASHFFWPYVVLNTCVHLLAVADLSSNLCAKSNVVEYAGAQFTGSIDRVDVNAHGQALNCAE